MAGRNCARSEGFRFHPIEVQSPRPANARLAEIAPGNDPQGRLGPGTIEEDANMIRMGILFFSRGALFSESNVILDDGKPETIRAKIAEFWSDEVDYAVAYMAPQEAMTFDSKPV